MLNNKMREHVCLSTALLVDRYQSFFLKKNNIFLGKMGIQIDSKSQ
jgi:hypothetical protein